MDSRRNRQLSLITKIVLIVLIFIVSMAGTMTIIISGGRGGSVKDHVHVPWTYIGDSESMEMGFVALGFSSLLICFISSILSCCSLRARNKDNKSIPSNNIVFIVIAALCLLIAGPLLLIAQQRECDFDRVLESEKKGANQLGELLGRMDKDSKTAKYKVIGIKRPRGKGGSDGSSSTTENSENLEPTITLAQAKEIFNSNCASYWNTTGKIVGGIFAIILSLLFVLPVLFDVKQYREKPMAENEMVVQPGAYGGAPTGNPYAMYYHNYQPQNGGAAFGPPVSPNYVASSDGIGPQMSPSQNPQVAVPQNAPPPEGQL